MIDLNITISVHKYNISLRNKDVIRICNQNTKTLLVAIEDAIESASNSFSIKQLKKITFKMKK